MVREDSCCRSDSAPAEPLPELLAREPGRTGNPDGRLEPPPDELAEPEGRAAPDGAPRPAAATPEAETPSFSRNSMFSRFRSKNAPNSEAFLPPGV